jgi:hypothetical protein
VVDRGCGSRQRVVMSWRGREPGDRLALGRAGHPRFFLGGGRARARRARRERRSRRGGSPPSGVAPRSRTIPTHSSPALRPVPPQRFPDVLDDLREKPVHGPSPRRGPRPRRAAAGDDDLVVLAIRRTTFEMVLRQDPPARGSRSNLRRASGSPASPPPVATPPRRRRRPPDDGELFPCRHRGGGHRAHATRSCRWGTGRRRRGRWPRRWSPAARVPLALVPGCPPDHEVARVPARGDLGYVEVPLRAPRRRHASITLAVVPRQRAAIDPRDPERLRAGLAAPAGARPVLRPRPRSRASRGSARRAGSMNRLAALAPYRRRTPRHRPRGRRRPHGTTRSTGAGARSPSSRRCCWPTPSPPTPTIPSPASRPTRTPAGEGRALVSTSPCRPDAAGSDRAGTRGGGPQPAGSAMAAPVRPGRPTQTSARALARL